MSVLFAILFYTATIILVVGLGLKIWTYVKTPQPLKVPTMPAPRTRFGAALRVAREVTIFQSLFRSNKWIWVFGYMFHVGLALVLIRHLRYPLEPVPDLIALEQPFGIIAAFVMVFGLAGLLALRIVVNRVRYISAFSDYFLLLLLLCIASSGLAMKFLVHTDIVAVKVFFLGLERFEINPLPADPLLTVHLSLVLTLMIVFPFSKLLHAPGVFFSPSRNQADDSRERRYMRRAA
ncbi:MAG: respiratory nitrate reductase subunit gamma [Alphaproteobacteria bacterium]|nr:respiratory nitrate reductase subunit gamma [Alphaproteobacteria bacterium]